MGMFRTAQIPHPDDALPGRAERMAVPERHAVLGSRLEPPFPAGAQMALFGLSTAVGYSGGTTPNPTYEEVCSGRTGHNEVVRVVFDPAAITYEELLAHFWEAHDPTQGMRQGNDQGTQYRSGIYTHSDDQLAAAERSRESFAPRLAAAGYGPITTEILPAGDFYYAEDYHQQYLHKVPNGYCGLGGTGVTCPVGVASA